MAGKMVEVAKEEKVKELLTRLPTPEELALLTGTSVDVVLVAMVSACRRRARRRSLAEGRNATSLADVAQEVRVFEDRLRAAIDARPLVSDELCHWVAHHAWRPVSARHAARLAGIARATAQRIALGRTRPEADPDATPVIKPRKVPRYYCEKCRRWVWLSPCVVCTALAARYPEEEGGKGKGEGGGI